MNGEQPTKREVQVVLLECYVAFSLGKPVKGFSIEIWQKKPEQEKDKYLAATV